MADVDNELIPYIDRARIDCENVFEFRCPLYWGDLEDTGDPAKRYCQQCDNHVHMVTSEAQFKTLVKRGECVAIMLADELPSPEQARRANAPRAMGMIAPIDFDDD